MKFAQIFFLSILLCIGVSVLSAYLMIRFIVGNFDDSAGKSVTNSQATIQNNEQPKDQTNNGSRTALSDLENGVKSIAAQLSPSVVSIVVSREVQTYRSDPFGFFYEPAGTVKRKVGGGTGFFVSKEGYLLTNKHVVSDPNAEYSVLLADGRELIGKVIAYDPITDLAIMRAFQNENIPYTESEPLAFVETQLEVEIGSFVIAIGNALAEFQNTVTFGVVSGLGRQIEAADATSGSSESLTGLIQTDTAINPGNSGGPLVNLQGKVVGINTAISQGANGIGFAIPLSERVVSNMIKSVVKYGQIKRPFIGIRYTLLNAELAESLGLSVKQGALVGGVSGGGISRDLEAIVPNSPAAKAGITAGDVILEVDGKLVSQNFGMRDALSEKLPGDSLTLKVFKGNDGQTVVVDLTLAESR